MTYPPKHFVVTDPRCFEGDPFEVAERAAEQAEALTRLAMQAADDANIMARNAELERQIIRDEELDAAGWEDSPQGVRWKHITATLGELSKTMISLRRAAGFNPRKMA